ncbi:helix-turn-helix domain-containing protein [Angustibacter luteus]|uniref:Helix-turn-helix domain-containing protein n=1 Tax=Angustibacter luteus TaxID=658456 RepID=A0ABW1JHB5_9ACTN
MPPRFLTLPDVAEQLNISAAQAYALVRSGDLPAIKVGGRGQWRVETSELETYIQRLYAQTREFVDSHPFGSTDGDETDRDDAVDADELSPGTSSRAPAAP